MALEHVRDRRARHDMAEVGQGAGEPQISPGWIVRSHLDDESFDRARDAWSPGAPFGAAIVLFGNELPVPAQQRVRGDQGVELFEGRSAELLGFRRQAASLAIGEADSSPALRLLFQDLVLCQNVFDDLVLFPVDPAGDRDDDDGPSVDERSHSKSVDGILVGTQRSKPAVNRSGKANKNGQVRSAE
jgi:hypothetical protein